jgi:hypothetical protein
VLGDTHADLCKLGLKQKGWDYSLTHSYAQSASNRGDLQFCGIVLEMFFDRVRTHVKVKECRAYGARTMLENLCSRGHS